MGKQFHRQHGWSAHLALLTQDYQVKKGGRPGSFCRSRTTAIWPQPRVNDAHGQCGASKNQLPVVESKLIKTKHQIANGNQLCGLCMRTDLFVPRILLAQSLGKREEVENLSI